MDIDLCVHDKRLAAIHEAGHLVTSTVLGKRARAAIWESNTSDRLLEKSWVGQVTYAIGDVPNEEPSPDEHLAGTAAEVLFDDPHSDAQDVLEHILDGEEDALSSTDIQGWSDDPEENFKVIQRLVQLLSDHRRFFEWSVAQLMEEGVVTDSMAAEFASLTERGDAPYGRGGVVN
jgi:hypothetical protein